MRLGLVVWTVLAIGCGKKGTEPATDHQPSDPVPAEPAPAEPAPADPAPAPAGGQMCGGLAAIQCGAGFACADDPNDTCNPAAGGADCSGICVACDDPSLERRSVSEDPKQCAVIRYVCGEGEAAYSDGCGCGCVKAP